MNNALEIKGLIKQYPSFRLGELELTLPSGCIMGLIGENGAGKSTAIRLILGTLRRDGGTVTVLGRDNLADSAALKEELGVVPDEIGLPEALTAEQIGRVMKRAFARWDGGVYADLLHRFSLPADRAFREFSLGMKKKLGIAVALSHHPRLLLLDEPTSGLDPVMRDEIVDLLNDFTREEDHSILISSHIVSDLEKLCDYVAFLHRGRLMLCDEKDALLARYGLLQCSAQELGAVEPSAVLGVKESAWGVQALVRRDAAPAGAALLPVGIEDLFVFMSKGAGPNPAEERSV